MIPVLALLAACGPEPAPAEIPVVTGTATGGHADPNMGAGFSDAAFPCCASAEATAVVQAAVALAAAMAADDEALAVGRLAELRAASTAVPALQEPVAALQVADLAAIRAGFAPLNEAVIGYARENAGGTARVAVAYCPMAPGRWLQASAPLANPYFGANMLRCGVFER